MTADIICLYKILLLFTHIGQLDVEYVQKGGVNLANPIRRNSELYDNLCIAFEETELKLRFDACYQLAKEASYEEIHFVISALKEAGFDEDLPDFSVAGFSLSNLMNALKAFVGAKVVRRKAFLLDILEEARDRKRPSEE